MLPHTVKSVDKNFDYTKESGLPGKYPSFKIFQSVSITNVLPNKTPSLAFRVPRIQLGTAIAAFLTLLIPSSTDGLTLPIRWHYA